MPNDAPGRPPYRKGDPRARQAGQKGGAVTAVQRRAGREPWRGSILDLMDAAGMVGDDWLPWRAFWCACYALPMTAAELALYRKHTKRETPPIEPVDEAWMEIGRGAGKTRNAALHAVYRAITFDSSTVAAGESVTIPLLASDRDQASAALKYVRGFNALGMVAPYVYRGDLSSKAEYKTGVDVQITTASFKAPRGRTSPTACCDEIAFWSDEGANPDNEILLAVRGTLGRVVGSVLLVLSNPYRPSGELHKAHEAYFGKATESAEDGVLVWNASTLAMRPSHPLRPIVRLRKADPVKCASEYGGDDGYVTFRQGDTALFDEAPVNAALARGRYQLPARDGVKYFAFLDAAEGSRSGDPMALGIAHRSGEGRAVLDVAIEVQPPYKPGARILTDFAPLLKAYGCREVTGDQHARGFVGEVLEGEGVKFIPSKLNKAQLFLELLQLVNDGVVELLDNSTLRTQLLALQRRPGRLHDSVDHPSGGHDDVANVAAGALVCVTGVGVVKKKPVYASFGPGQSIGGPGRQPGNVHNALGELARAEIAKREAQDEADWRREKAVEQEPMRGEPVWYVHRPFNG